MISLDDRIAELLTRSFRSPGPWHGSCPAGAWPLLLKPLPPWSPPTHLISIETAPSGTRKSYSKLILAGGYTKLLDAF